MTELTMTESLLSAATRDQIDQWLKKYPANQKRSAVLYALRIVQAENGGWLTEELMEAVANYLELSTIAVFEVATFYSMYDLKPVGRNKIKICTSISCMLRGSDKLISHLQTKLGISVGETTPDKMFTLQEVECLAACGGAPAIMINDEMYYENLTSQKLDVILDTIKEAETANG